MGFIKYERVLLISFFLCVTAIARANPGFFLPLDQYFDPGINAYVDTNPAIGSVSTWQGSASKTCAFWTTDAIAQMCLGKTYDQHRGTDFNTLNPGQKGYFAAPVYAAASGIVEHIETGQANNKSCGCFGNYVKVDHGDGWETIYGHLDSVNGKLTEGMWIPVHEFLGNAGNSGASSGDHLHFEIRHNGQHLDPYTHTNLWCSGTPQFYAGEPCDETRWHPAGTMVHVPSQPEYYRVGEDGLLHHMFNEDVYFAHGYTWAMAVSITPQEKSCYISAQNPITTLPKRGIVREKKWLGLTSVYWMYEGSVLDFHRFRKELHKKDAAIVAASWGLELPESDDDTAVILANYHIAPGYVRLRNGTLFKRSGHPEIYVMENGMHRWLMDWETFTFAGYSIDNVHVISSASMPHIVGTPSVPLTKNDFTRCMIEACQDNDQASAMLCAGNIQLDEDGDDKSLAFDCNDHDPKMAHGFVEVCDEVDNNCNTLTDENGVCDFAIAIEENDPSSDPTDEAENDCQPTQEFCNDGIDNDCDGIVDNGCGPCGGKTDGTACNDDDACTKNDICLSGVCWGESKTCNDGNMCTDDACDPQLGCTIAYNTLGCTPDGNPCTHDICSWGTCTHPPMDFLCNDGDPCTHEDTCKNGTCVAGTFICECKTAQDCANDDPCMEAVCKNNTCVLNNICVQETPTDAATDEEPPEQEPKQAESTQEDPPAVSEDDTQDSACAHADDKAEKMPIDKAETITITWNDPTLLNLDVADLIGCVGLSWDGLGMQCNESEWTYSNLFGCMQSNVGKFTCDVHVPYGRTMWFNVQFFPAHDYGSGYLETYACGMNGTYTGNVDVIAPKNVALFTSCEPDANGNFNMMLTVAGETSLVNAGGLVENGSFEMGVNGWMPEIHEWEDASMTLDCDNSYDGYCAQKTEFASSPKADYAVQLVGRIAVKAGKQYKMTFAARAQSPRAVRAWLGKSGPPFNTYGLNHTVQLTTEWMTFTVVFTALETDMNAKLGMVLGQDTSTVWIDAINISQITP